MAICVHSVTGEKGGRTKVKTRLLALLLLAGGSLFAESHVSIGVGIGVPGYYAPPPPPVVVYERPPCPYPDYTWVEGYWYPVGPRYNWHAGYWSAPHYYEHRYYEDYGRHGWDHHERHWDRDEHGRGHGHHH